MRATTFAFALVFLAVQTASVDAQQIKQPQTQPIGASGLVFQERNGVVAVEAEHFVSQEKTSVRAWYRVAEGQLPGVTPDLDGPHLADSSGGCYLEALPDSRVTHGDKLQVGENFFPKPGAAGVLTYRVHITNPGRYFVWVRHLSTGTEDNGLHVGLDGAWPESGQRWQTTKKRKWAWESRQRTAKVHVGVRFQLYLDIEAGEHKIHFSMREDGFEFDKFVLASDRDYIPKGFGPDSNVKSEHVICPPAGRLAIVADGNSPDPDDIGATAVIFGLLHASGFNDRLVHLSHSCRITPQTITLVTIFLGSRFWISE